jgi:hypothetical protein
MLVGHGRPNMAIVSVGLVNPPVRYPASWDTLEEVGGRNGAAACVTSKHGGRIRNYGRLVEKQASPSRIRRKDRENSI